MRPGHLAELLRGGDEDSSRLLRALDRLVVTALQGDLHPVITEHICSARLFPLKKKNGKARPVAVGDTFLRVIEKVALALPASKELLASLLPIQTGLSGNAICVQVALSLQAILACQPLPREMGSPPGGYPESVQHSAPISHRRGRGEPREPPSLMDPAVPPTLKALLRRVHPPELRGRPTRGPSEPLVLLTGDSRGTTELPKHPSPLLVPGRRYTCR